jgi:(1->4)-alpha-D-glucan 1-alpha-D-glucosylmutase
VVIHLTAPGTPDLYQGDELWNFTLVDPDNRRQIDYDVRTAVLDRLAAVEQRLRSGGKIDATDSGIKLLVTHRLLDARRSAARLFVDGRYEPLEVRGPRAEHVVAFARIEGDRAAVTIAPRLMRERQVGVEQEASWWGDTAINLPQKLRDHAWRAVLMGGDVTGEAELPVANLLRPLPVAVLMS